MAMARLVVLASVVGLVSGAKELTLKDFDKEVFDSGKGAFIKFLAPWCGHCKSLKPDWDKLEKAFKGSDAVGVFDVDCTTGGEQLCQKYGVKGYPTIKYWKAGSKSGIDYQGGRDFNALKTFTENTFKASCDGLTGKGCNEQEKRYIDKTKDKSVEELATERKEKEDDLKAMKKERTAAQNELKEKEKKWKSKETALTKAVGLLKTFEKAAAKRKPKEEKASEL